MSLCGVVLTDAACRDDNGGLILAGRSMLDHTIDRIGPQVDCLVLWADDTAPTLEAFGLPLVAPEGPIPDDDAGRILMVLDWAAAMGCDYVVVVPAGVPFLPADFVTRLRRATRQAGTVVAVAARTTGACPTIGMWPTHLGDALRHLRAQGPVDLVGWVDALGATQVVFTDDDLFEVQCDADLLRAEEILRTRPV